MESQIHDCKEELLFSGGDEYLLKPQNGHVNDPCKGMHINKYRKMKNLTKKRDSLIGESLFLASISITNESLRHKRQQQLP